MSLLHTETITVRSTTFGQPDADGVPTEVVTETDSEGWNIQPAGTTESLGNEHIVTGRWKCSADSLQDWILEGYTVKWRGTKYNIEGKPQHYVGGAIDHTEMIIRLSKG